MKTQLLGIDSHDIDIALDDMMGEEFIRKLKIDAEGTKDTVSGIGVIKSNPDLSKHLETATARING